MTLHDYATSAYDSAPFNLPRIVNPTIAVLTLAALSFVFKLDVTPGSYATFWLGGYVSFAELELYRRRMCR
jgi:hypothetical protein